MNGLHNVTERKNEKDLKAINGFINKNKFEFAIANVNIKNSNQRHGSKNCVTLKKIKSKVKTGRRNRRKIHSIFNFNVKCRDTLDECNG